MDQCWCAQCPKWCNHPSNIRWGASSGKTSTKWIWVQININDADEDDQLIAISLNNWKYTLDAGKVWGRVRLWNFMYLLSHMIAYQGISFIHGTSACSCSALDRKPLYLGLIKNTLLSIRQRITHQLWSYYIKYI